MPGSPGSPGTDPVAGDPPPADPGQQPGDGALSDASRQAALALVAGKWSDLAASGTLQGRAQAMAVYMATLPAYTETGVHDDALCAWGRFADGRAHIVSFSETRAPVGAAAAAAASSASGRARIAAAKPELPGAARARLMHSFGADYEDGNGIVGDLSGWLDATGYSVRNGAPGDASLQVLRNVRGDGFFYIGTHGGAWGHTERTWEPLAGIRMPNHSPMLYSITSSTTYSAELERTPEMADDLANSRLTYFTASNGLSGPDGKPLSSQYYGITEFFVAKYWSFAANSVVVVNACSSARTEARWAGNFIAAVHHVGAACCAGWTETVSWQGAGRAPRYFVDRLLGANQCEPREMPRQRAFAWDKVLPDMQRRGVDRNPGNSARFVVRANPALANPQALAPSIRQCEVVEALDELHLQGDFGRVAGRVTLAQREIAVLEWLPERIRCSLPRSGAQSVGDVQVLVGSVQSNVRCISEWNVAIDNLHQDAMLPALTVRGSGNLRFRADVGAVRDEPGQVPVKPVVYAVTARESSYTASASGSVYAPSCVSHWSGSGTWVVPQDLMSGQLPPLTLQAYARFDTDNGRFALAPISGMVLGTTLPFVNQCDGQRFNIGFGDLHGEAAFRAPGGAGPVFRLQALQTLLDGRQGVLGAFVTRDEDTFRVRTAAAAPLASAGDAI